MLPLLCTWNLLREQSLNVLIKEKKIYTGDDGCVNYHDGGNPFTM